MFFSEYQIGIDYPPAITHPEYFYGVLSVTLAWQILFLFIAINPVKYKLLIIAAVIEKFSYGTALIILFSQNRLPMMILSGGIIDLVLGLLFVVAFFKAKENKTVEHLEEKQINNTSNKIEKE